MADEQEDGEAQGQADHEPRECMACRGTGRVISNLGGSTAHVDCPWCRGSGRRIPGVDAQARFIAEREAGGAGSLTGETPDDPGASAATDTLPSDDAASAGPTAPGA